jgi:hypothetical protein
MKTNYILTTTAKFVFSILTFPAAFIIIIVLQIENHSKFISAADGSVGPAFDAYLTICGIILSLIWISYPAYKLIKKYFERNDISG